MGGFKDRRHFIGGGGGPAMSGPLVCCVVKVLLSHPNQGSQLMAVEKHFLSAPHVVDSKGGPSPGQKLTLPRGCIR